MAVAFVRRGLWAMGLLAAMCIEAVAHSTTEPLGSVIIEADGGTVLSASNPNRSGYPASLSKLMTAMLVFEGLERGAIQLATKLPVSAHAAAQPATKIHLRKGSQVRVDTLLNALLAVSANDAAVVLAEGLHGSEPKFVEEMNAKADDLGLERTRFVNASGLPGPGQRTTATDMAMLARALWRGFPERAAFYSRPNISFGKRRFANVNAFLTAFEGADGMKTGFTCAAGFNLAASASRDGRRLIGVVLGAPTRGVRLSRMRSLMKDAFAKLGATQPEVKRLEVAELAARDDAGAALPLPVGAIAGSCHSGHVGRQITRWSIDVGADPDRRNARKQAHAFISERRRAGYRLGGARVITVPRWIGVQLHRAVVTGLGQAAAVEACIEYRNTGGDCVVVPPAHLRAQIEDAKRIRRLQKDAEQRRKNRSP